MWHAYNPKASHVGSFVFRMLFQSVAKKARGMQIAHSVKTKHCTIHTRATTLASQKENNTQEPMMGDTLARPEDYCVNSDRQAQSLWHRSYNIIHTSMKLFWPVSGVCPNKTIL